MWSSVLEVGGRHGARRLFRFAGRVAVVLAWVGAVGCGFNDGPPLLADDSRRSVMLIDDGFDTTVTALQGKVAVAYTAVCEGPGGPASGAGGIDLPDAGGDDGGAADGGTDEDGGSAVGGDDGPGGPGFGDLKVALIASLGVADESCHLRDGIEPKAPFGVKHESQRQSWNAALSDDSLPASGYEALIADLSAEVGSKPFHGTATAGTMAHGLSGLRMVLVELPLSTPEQVSAAFTCPTQADVDLIVSLLSDPEVRAAYLARPPAAFDRELADLRASRGVSLVNESFGPVTRFGFEKLELAMGCQSVDIEMYFHVIDELERTYSQAYAEPGVLFVRSAGNDGAVLNTGDDGAQCHPGDEHQVLVGAYGTDGVRSPFTNFGDCVDVYAPGEAIVAPLPGNWLTVLSGTSFAAPLVARMLAVEAPTPFAPQTARAFLAQTRLANRNIALSHFPPEVVFDVHVAASKRALVAAPSTSPGGDDANRDAGTPSPTGVPSPPTLAPSAPAMRHALWPLGWAARHSRRR